jgi:hypothetical protein
VADLVEGAHRKLIPGEMLEVGEVDLEAVASSHPARLGRRVNKAAHLLVGHLIAEDLAVGEGRRRRLSKHHPLVTFSLLAAHHLVLIEVRPAAAAATRCHRSALQPRVYYIFVPK